MQTTDNGTYLEDDDRPAVRFERTCPHPIELVWEAISDPAEMRHWFPSPNVEHHARAGGSITLSGDPYATDAKATRLGAQRRGRTVSGGVMFPPSSDSLAGRPAKLRPARRPRDPRAH